MVYGNGVYFATNASYSTRDMCSPRDFNGNKRVYRCRVLTGEFCQGVKGMKLPPNKSGAASNCSMYDSMVNNVKNPGIFVIFNDIQAYPEYLITFQWNLRNGRYWVNYLEVIKIVRFFGTPVLIFLKWR